MLRIIFSVTFLALLVLISGCSTVSYYGQSVVGHSKLMLARQPLPKAIKAAKESNNQKRLQQLELAQKLRQFSVNRLSLPNNKSYTSFVPLKREFPVWVVVAAEEFSVEAKQWCYPVIGCAAYRGYFSEQAAKEYADKLKQQGYETVVQGASAYSTLGWFSDPILPSMIRYGEANFADVLFHELAHQKLYLKGDSDFNEAYASVVGEQGAILWLSENRPELLEPYQAQLAAQQRFDTLVAELRKQLSSLYASQLSQNQMRSQKQALFVEFKNKYQSVVAEYWQGQNWFSRWFDKPINNARLVAISTYRKLVPEFERLLLISCEGDFSRFYQSLQQLDSNKNASKEVPQNCWPKKSRSS